MNITVEKQIDKNTKEVFSFWFYENRATLYLDSYDLQRRDTPRHKFKTVKKYSRLDYPRHPDPIKLKDVPLTEEIKKQALEVFMSTIKVDVWKDMYLGAG